MDRAQACRKNFENFKAGKIIESNQHQPALRFEPVAIEQRARSTRRQNPDSPTPDQYLNRPLDKMVVVNYLLFESAVGFSLFEVVHQADTVGLELPEVKDAMKSLDKFGKMVQLRSFNPWT
jgi:hypothetical protein